MALLALATLSALAQTRPRIGVVEFGVPPESTFARGYLAALRELGYAEPDRLLVERRYAEGDTARLGAIFQDLAAAKVDLVFTVGNDLARIAQRANPSLRIVTAGSDDPVMSGLIADYRRPGRNVTGVTYLSTQLASKRLELLKEALPGASRVAVLRDPGHFDTYYQEMEPAARALGLQLRLLEARTLEELAGAVAAARGARADALFVLPSRLFNSEAPRITRLALEAKLPVMSAYANVTDAGGLISYGAVAAEMLKRAAVQTDRILRGASPGDVPFERAATFELVINRRTARSLGLSIPRSLLARADRIVD